MTKPPKAPPVFSLFDEADLVETAIEQSPTPPPRALKPPAPETEHCYYQPDQTLIEAAREVLPVLPDGITTDDVLHALNMADEAIINQHRSRIIDALVSPDGGQWQGYRDENGTIRYRRKQTTT